jgi:hypothetical protein
MSFIVNALLFTINFLCSFCVHGKRINYRMNKANETLESRGKQLF